MLPTLVPATTAGLRPTWSSALIMPMCASPRTAPPRRAKPTRLDLSERRTSSMFDHYHTEKEEPKTEIEVAADRLNRISELIASSKKQTDKKPGRNILTRAIDSTFALVRKYLPPLHWLGAALVATVMFLYAQVVTFTSRLDRKSTRLNSSHSQISYAVFCLKKKKKKKNKNKIYKKIKEHLNNTNN